MSKKNDQKNKKTLYINLIRIQHKTKWLLALLCFIVISCQPQKTKVLLIATAANMQFAIEEITKVFEEETGVQCQLSISSSGKLTAQIKEGAPFDVFLSADMKYPSQLYQEGFSSAPKIYAYGRLILWSMGDFPPSIETLENPSLKHVAIANPKTAPYGKAAMEVLHKLALDKTLKTRLVFGESISQTNQFIATQAAEIGFTAKSVVRSPQMSGKGYWIEIDTSMYSPIIQGIVLLNNGKAPKGQAQKFQDFLFSTKGKEILNKFGYSPNYSSNR